MKTQIIVSVFTLLSSIGLFCKYTYEIPYVHLLKNKSDSEIICEYYSSNRDFFYEQKNSFSSQSSNKIKQRLSELDLSNESIDSFLQYWEEDAKLHRERTVKRDSMYIEGVRCLKKILFTEIPEFESYAINTQKRLSKSLTRSERSIIDTGINNYLAFIEMKKQHFFEEESLLYGELGVNIVEYSQLSFEVISRVLTGEYRFGFRHNFKSKILEIFSNNKILQEEFETYQKRESRLVTKITNDDCLKRLGVLRYYDLLSDDRKIEAMKINMMLNIFKKRPHTNTIDTPH